MILQRRIVDILKKEKLSGEMEMGFLQLFGKMEVFLKAISLMTMLVEFVALKTKMVTLFKVTVNK